MPTPEGEFFRTMIARISPDDIVLYANGAMASYLQVKKSDLAGAPLEVLAAHAHGEISDCFQRPETGRATNRLVTDDEGRVFEVKTYSEGGVLDIVLDEVTTAESVNRDLRYVSGTSVDLLDEEELRTARQPERRFMTVSQVRLNGMAHLAERLAPMETRLMLNSFVEESADAILETGCAYYQSSGETVVGLFGAPRYFADHALRAVQAACNQMEKSSRLRAGFFRQGKEMPPMSCGIWTGETFVGTLGSSATQRYSAIGITVELAAELCRLARPGEILISEISLRNIIHTLPEGWQAIRAESEIEPDLSDFHWSGDEIQPLPAGHVRGVWLIGPGIREDSSRTEFYADYLYSIKTRGLEEAVPVLRVVRPAMIGDSLELSTDNVVSTQFAQMLGKYKLLKVIGTGGMGKVWKGQDRYGNTVAIKVLHSTEATTDAQLKRFQREAEVMSRLPHRNICRVFEMSEFEGIQYLVMEYVDGLTLADLLYERTRAESGGSRTLPDLKSLIYALREERSSRDETPPEEEETVASRPKKTRILPVEQTLNMFLKVCEAVQFAHEHGVLHRDLKPGNILLREDGEPLVADFGLAKIRSADSGQSLSVSGHVVGTLENMSPEQAESSKEVDERADVYALGTILFQMLTGRRHFEATGNIVADAQALQTHEPPRPRSINPRLDSDLEVILLKALRNSPVERYRSVKAFEADLEHYRKGEAITARPVSAIDLLRKLVLRNRAVTAVIAGSLLILLAGSVVAFWKITERAKVAEDALADARVQKERALKNELLAEEQKRQAEQQKAIAELKQQEAEEALKETHRAKDQANLALKETEEEKKKRIDAQKEAKALAGEGEKLTDKLTEAEKRLEELKTAKLERPEPGYPPFRRQPRAENDAAFQRAMTMSQEALFQFHNELNPGRLSLRERNPEFILGKVGEGLESVSQAILSDPAFAPAWMMKGRYHMACMELAQAKEAFQTAEKHEAARLSQDKQKLLGPDDDPGALADLCDQVIKAAGDRFSNAAKLLAGRNSPVDRITAEVIGFFNNSKIKKSAFGQSPMDRSPGQAEIAVNLIAANGGAGRVTFQGGANGMELTISGMAELTDLSPLKKLPSRPIRVRIEGVSTLDWTTLAAIPLEALDLTGCQLSAIPPAAPSFQRLQNLVLKDTAFSELSCVRKMPQLASLDISGTQITDLSPLGGCRRLQSLDAGMLSLEGLRTLGFLPLARLTISPMMISDKAALNGLKTLRMLRVLRAPGDPEDQPAAEFWRKLDSGGYDTGE
ncbi:MAG: protein kinase [Terrimicrobiaceae bacterium]|nr:protein kinase [Terrimicrobiaceae bacterium]